MSNAPIPITRSAPTTDRSAVILSLRPGSAPASQPSGLHLRLMGSFELTDGGMAVNLSVSAQRLVALLALEHRPIGRSHAACILWPDKPEARAAANLRSTLWRLNNNVAGLIESDNGSVRLADAVTVDVNSLAGCLGDSPWAAAELLVDWYDEWVVIERERIRQQTLRTLENASAELRAAGLYSAAIDAGSAAVKMAPLRESAHRAVIETHLAEGNYAEAVRQYESFSAILFDALGVLPSPALAEFFNPNRAAESVEGQGDELLTQ